MVSITIIGMRTAEIDSGFAFVYNVRARLGGGGIEIDISTHIIRLCDYFADLRQLSLCN